KASHTNRFCGTKVKVVFWQVNAAAVFADERMLVPKSPARLIHLRPRPGGHPHDGQPGVIEFGSKFLESCQRFSAHRHNRINGTEHNRRRLAQANDSEILRTILACSRRSSRV